MSDRKRPRGGREARVRLALDLCRQAHRRGDVETQKRALETLCMCYDVNPTELTGQGMRALSFNNRPRQSVGLPAPACPPPAPLIPPPAPTPPEPLAPLDVEMIFRDPETIDRLMEDIENFIRGVPPQ